MWEPKWPKAAAPPAQQMQQQQPQNAQHPQGGGGGGAQRAPIEKCSKAPWYKVPMGKAGAEADVTKQGKGGFVVRNSSKPGCVL